MGGGAGRPPKGWPGRHPRRAGSQARGPEGLGFGPDLDGRGRRAAAARRFRGDSDVHTSDSCRVAPLAPPNICFL